MIISKKLKIRIDHQFHFWSSIVTGRVLKLLLRELKFLGNNLLNLKALKYKSKLIKVSRSLQMKKTLALQEIFIPVTVMKNLKFAKKLVLKLIKKSVSETINYWREAF